MPIADCVKNTVSEQQALSFALTGGDDYQLCFCLPMDREDDLKATIKEMPIRKIGHIVEGEQLTLLNADGQQMPLPSHDQGYQHFT